jgi:hypothetical protein
VLEDELLLVVRFEDHTILVKAPDTTRQFHATGQINRYWQPFLARCVQESVLNVLIGHGCWRWFIHVVERRGEAGGGAEPTLKAAL